MIRKEEGQSLVEFALILPVLLVLLIGIFDFGRILYVHLNMELVAQESVRMGGLGQGDQQIKDYAREQFSAGEASELVVVINPPEAERVAGEYVSVTLSYPESFFDLFGDNAIPYTAKTSSTMRVE